MPGFTSPAMTVATVCTLSHSVIAGPLPAMTLRRATRARIRSLGSAQKSPAGAGPVCDISKSFSTTACFSPTRGGGRGRRGPEVEAEEPLCPGVEDDEPLFIEPLFVELPVDGWLLPP